MSYLKTTVEELPGSKVALTVEIPTEDLKDEFSAAYKTLASKYKFDGFRKGKVPTKIIDARLGKETVYHEVVQSSVPKYYIKAIRDKDIFPIAQPNIEVKEAPPNEKLIFKANVLVKPRVEISDYKSITVEMEKQEVATGEIMEKINALREKFSELKPKDGVIGENDFALVDYTLYLKDKKIDELSTTDYMLDISSPDLLPDLKKKLVGTKKGDIVESQQKMDQNVKNPEIAGKDVTVKWLIKEVKEKILPKLDDEFAKNVSEFDLLKDLKNNIKQSIEAQKQHIYDLQLKQKVLGYVGDKAVIDVPEEMVNLESNRMYDEFIKSLQSRNITLQQYAEASKVSEEKLKEGFKNESKRLIKNELVLDKISEIEKIDVSEEILNQEIGKHAAEAKIPFDEYKKNIEQNNYLYTLKDDLRLKLTLDFLAENAKITDKVEKEKTTEKKDKKTKEENK